MSETRIGPFVLVGRPDRCEGCGAETPYGVDRCDRCRQLAARTPEEVRTDLLALREQECAVCAAKPGAPLLCAACLHNRKAIGDLQVVEATPPYPRVYGIWTGRGWVQDAHGPYTVSLSPYALEFYLHDPAWTIREIGPGGKPVEPTP